MDCVCLLNPLTVSVSGDDVYLWTGIVEAVASVWNPRCNKVSVADYSQRKVLVHGPVTGTGATLTGVGVVQLSMDQSDTDSSTLSS